MLKRRLEKLEVRFDSKWSGPIAEYRRYYPDASAAEVIGAVSGLELFGRLKESITSRMERAIASMIDKYPDLSREQVIADMRPYISRDRVEGAAYCVNEVMRRTEADREKAIELLRPQIPDIDDLMRQHDERTKSRGGKFTTTGQGGINGQHPDKQGINREY